jgi:hypothetical protein
VLDDRVNGYLSLDAVRLLKFSIVYGFESDNLSFTKVRLATLRLFLLG